MFAEATKRSNRVIMGRSFIKLALKRVHFSQFPAFPQELRLEKFLQGLLEEEPRPFGIAIGQHDMNSMLVLSSDDPPVFRVQRISA